MTAEIKSITSWRWRQFCSRIKHTSNLCKILHVFARPMKSAQKHQFSLVAFSFRNTISPPLQPLRETQLLKYSCLFLTKTNQSGTYTSENHHSFWVWWGWLWGRKEGVVLHFEEDLLLGNVCRARRRDGGWVWEMWGMLKGRHASLQREETSIIQEKQREMVLKTRTR